MHALQHFRVDADIRAKDERYAQWQTQQLSRIAGCLAVDRDVDPEILEALEPRPVRLLGLLSRRKT